MPLKREGFVVPPFVHEGQQPHAQVGNDAGDGEPAVVVANLPYNIATPVISKSAFAQSVVLA